jgi:hypothetical protein
VVSLRANILIWSSDQIVSSEIDLGRANRIVHAQVSPVAGMRPAAPVFKTDRLRFVEETTVRSAPLAP